MEKNSRNRYFLRGLIGIVGGLLVLSIILLIKDVPRDKWLPAIIGGCLVGILVLVNQWIDQTDVPMWLRIVSALMILIVGVYLLVEGIHEHSIKSIILCVASFALGFFNLLRLIRGDSPADE